MKKKVKLDEISSIYSEYRHFENGLRPLVSKGLLNREYNVIWPSLRLLRASSIIPEEYWAEEKYVFEVIE